MYTERFSSIIANHVNKSVEDWEQRFDDGHMSMIVPITGFVTGIGGLAGGSALGGPAAGPIGGILGFGVGARMGYESLGPRLADLFNETNRDVMEEYIPSLAKLEMENIILDTAEQNNITPEELLSKIESNFDEYRDVYWGMVGELNSNLIETIGEDVWNGWWSLEYDYYDDYKDQPQRSQFGHTYFDSEGGGYNERPMNDEEMADIVNRVEERIEHLNGKLAENPMAFQGKSAQDIREEANEMATNRFGPPIYTMD